MTNQLIIEAQDYLRVRTKYGCKRIADIHRLLERLNTQEVIAFLKDNLREKEKSLKSMILTDKSHPKVDQTVAAMFRISMAIHTLEQREEVIIIERSQQGAEKSGQFHKRNSGGHSGAGIGQDKNHDGKNRFSGHETKRAA